MVMNFVRRQHAGFHGLREPQRLGRAAGAENASTESAAKIHRCFTEVPPPFVPDARALARIGAPLGRHCHPFAASATKASTSSAVVANDATSRIRHWSGPAASPAGRLCAVAHVVARPGSLQPRLDGLRQQDEHQIRPRPARPAKDLTLASPAASRSAIALAWRASRSQQSSVQERVELQRQKPVLGQKMPGPLSPLGHMRRRVRDRRTPPPRPPSRRPWSRRTTARRRRISR